MIYVVQAFVLVWVLWFVHPVLGTLGFWALLGAGIGVSASQRRGYPLASFASWGAVLGLFAVVLYLAPRRHLPPGGMPERILISDEALAGLQQAIRDHHAREADRLRAVGL